MRPRFLVVPDSFKGSLSAIEVSHVIATALKDQLPDADVITVPVADGGEGSVDAFLAAVGGEHITLRVAGPYGVPMDASYAILNDGSAVVEVAAAAGLPLVGENRQAGAATTFGVGEQIRDAVLRGCRTVIVGLGGSATNDGGCGAAAANAVLFFDNRHRAFVPVGDTLCRIAHIDVADARTLLQGVEVVAMCDVDNPLTGEHGAAAVFGPQKGADPDQVAALDAGLAHLAAIIDHDLALDVANLPGAGAAGGMGAGLVAFFGARLQSGVDTVLDVANFDRLVSGATAVITGEGSLDSQSLRGKVISGVARRAASHGVPVYAVAGRVEPQAVRDAEHFGITEVLSINPPGQPLEVSLSKVEENLAETIKRLALRWRT